MSFKRTKGPSGLHFHLRLTGKSGQFPSDNRFRIKRSTVAFIKYKKAFNKKKNDTVLFLYLTMSYIVNKMFEKFGLAGFYFFPYKILNYTTCVTICHKRGMNLPNVNDFEII